MRLLRGIGALGQGADCAAGVAVNTHAIDLYCGTLEPIDGTLDPDVYELRDEFDALLTDLRRWWCEMTGVEHKEFPK